MRRTRTTFTFGDPRSFAGAAAQMAPRLLLSATVAITACSAPVAAPQSTLPAHPVAVDPSASASSPPAATPRTPQYVFAFTPKPESSISLGPSRTGVLIDGARVVVSASSVHIAPDVADSLITEVRLLPKRFGGGYLSTHPPPYTPPQNSTVRSLPSLPFQTVSVAFLSAPTAFLFEAATVGGGPLHLPAAPEKTYPCRGW
ncbi:MAG: hypothetical protein IPK82_18300 [Polyangiaceae bacterium]|nr:hypothetical protein [Polyangiaceae bacterium]